LHVCLANRTALKHAGVYIKINNLRWSGQSIFGVITVLFNWHKLTKGAIQHERKINDCRFVSFLSAVNQLVTPSKDWRWFVAVSRYRTLYIL